MKNELNENIKDEVFKQRMKIENVGAWILGGTGILLIAAGIITAVVVTIYSPGTYTTSYLWSSLGAVGLGVAVMWLAMITFV